MKEPNMSSEQLRSAIHEMTEEELDRLGVIALDLFDGGDGDVSLPDRYNDINQINEAYDERVQDIDWLVEDLNKAIKLLQETLESNLPSLVRAKINRFIEGQKIEH